jgi:homopolymeric O-antigen transport system permease protein
LTSSGLTSTTSANDNSLQNAFADLGEALQRYRLWWSLALEDIRQAYRQTVFGIIWAVLSYVIFAVAIITAFTGGKPSPDFAGYIIIGLLTWNYISSVILESSTVFIGAESFIKGIRLPLTLHVLRCVARIGVTTFYAAVGAAALLVVFRAPVHLMGIAAIPAILVLVLTAVAVQILFGTLCSYSRDFKYIIENLMRPVFFITPIFWVGPAGSVQEILERYNPFTHYIQIVRAPIIYGTVPVGSWVISLAISAVLWVAAIFVLRQYRSQIVFWI